MTETTPTYDGKPISAAPKDDDVKWLALLIRQGLKVIVAGIEKRYGLEDWRKECDRRIA